MDVTPFSLFLWNYNAIEIQSSMDNLSREERLRASLINPVERKKAYAAGRILLRKVFRDFVKITEEVNLIKNSSGAFEPVDNIYFNLSHTKNIVAVSFSKVAPVGVDIESKTTARNIEAIMSRYGNAYEKIFFPQLKEDAKLDYFYKLWTIKESFGKATGLGLQESLKDLEIDVLNNFIIKNLIYPQAQIFFGQILEHFLSVTILDANGTSPAIFLVEDITKKDFYLPIHSAPLFLLK
jgi:4'-phosphopantetheinyl transferase